MEKRDCDNCKYENLNGHSEPCSYCLENTNGCFSEWTEKEKTDESHYKTGEYECIKVMLDVFGKEAVMYFAMLNAFKYLWRNEHKGHANDLKKAKDYIELYLELVGE